MKTLQVTLKKRWFDMISSGEKNMSSFDHKKFVRQVREITGCDHDKAFEVLGIVLEHTQRAFIQGASAVHNAEGTGPSAKRGDDELPTDICSYCEKSMCRSEGLVPDDDGVDGQMMHLSCAAEEADNVGFDGWIQDQG